MNGQQPRSEAEKALPEWLRAALDKARSGIDPMTNSKISPSEAATYVNSWLPPDDPGRL